MSIIFHHFDTKQWVGYIIELRGCEDKIIDYVSILLVNLGGNPSPRTFSSSHLIFEDYLKEKQYRESTIETKRKLVGFLRKRVNLWDSEAKVLR